MDFTFDGDYGCDWWCNLGPDSSAAKTHFNAQETLTTLMMNYVAFFLLMYLVNGPWRDPDGMNFPQSLMFSESATLPLIMEGTRINASIFITIIAVVLFWVLSVRV